MSLAVAAPGEVVSTAGKEIGRIFDHELSLRLECGYLPPRLPLGVLKTENTSLTLIAHWPRAWSPHPRWR